MQNIASSTLFGQVRWTARTVWLAIPVVVVAGCGQQDYQSRLDKSLVKVMHQAKFSDLDLTRSVIANTPVSFRLPAAMGQRYSPESENTDGPGKMPIARLQPGKIVLPDVRLVCQGLGKNEAGVDVPYFCHIAVVPKAVGNAAAAPPVNPNAPPANPNAPPGDAAATPATASTTGPAAEPAAAPATDGKPLAQAIRDEVLAAYPGTADWETIACETPLPGQTLEWKRMQAKGEDDYQKFGISTPTAMPGTLSVY
ncbi:MAG TPA: hypothetical protein VG713_20745, partial [Pirellulales bacterium]|nr:hypothetical protein [Pirellulales bacterium]